MNVGDEPTLDALVEVRTHSGSVYRVGRDEQGRWWMTACNVPHERSRRLEMGRWWHVQRPSPWPPELGERLWLIAPDDVDPGDPRRVPGGGRHTSLVRAVRQPDVSGGEEER